MIEIERKVTCDVCGEEITGDYDTIAYNDIAWHTHPRRYAPLDKCGNDTIAAIRKLFRPDTGQEE